MTIPSERYNSIKHTRTLLYALINPKDTPRVPKEIRDWARRCLRHYPSDFDMDSVAEKVPESFSNKGLADDLTLGLRV